MYEEFLRGVYFAVFNLESWLYRTGNYIRYFGFGRICFP